MLRLPPFRLLQPSSIEEALHLRADCGSDAAFVAGGTDLYPNMKRRQLTPRALVSVARIPAMRAISVRADGGVDIGASATLTEVASNETVRTLYPAVAHAAAQVSTPLLRNMGTIGGNLLIDTRCNYYNQSFEWRRAINFCMKKDGAICWVAPSSPRCWAVQSSDGVPVAVAIGAEVSLAGANSVRKIPAAALYNNDGIEHLAKQADELLVAYHLPAPGNWSATYVKLRRRGSFDFPVLSVGAWLAFHADNSVADARIVLGAVGSAPIVVEDAAAVLTGAQLDEESIGAAAQLAHRIARPLDNTDFALRWRKEMVRVHVQRALAGIHAARGLTRAGSERGIQ